jgi:hypothetical protein
MLDAQRTGSGGLAKLGEGVRANSDAKTQAGLTRGPNLSKKLINAAWTDTFPAQGATLDLDFANDRGFVRGIGQGKSMDAVTFTRASNGNYVKPDGTLSSHANQGALGNNLLTFPQDFDNAAWSKTGVTVEGQFIRETATTGQHTLFRPTFDLANAVIYCDAKANGRNWLRIGTRQAAGVRRAYFDLENGVVGTVFGDLTASIEDRGNGVYRCYLYGSMVANASGLQIGPTSADNTTEYTGDDNLGVFVYLTQVESGIVATEYFPTNIGQPRFDWASTAVVAQRNLLTYTDDISNAIWAPDFGGTVSKSGNTISFTVASSDRRFALIYNVLLPTIDGETYTLQARFEVSAGSEVIALGVRAGGAIFGWLAFNTTTNSIVGTYSISTIYTGISLISATEVSPNVWDMAIAVVSNGRSYQPLIHFGADGQSASDLRLNGNGSGSINLSRVQFEVGDTATAYQSVGAQLATNIPLAANPTSNGLLIEEARTNRILWCRDATDAAWVKTNVTAAKDQTGIDGVASAASSLTATANDGTCIQTITLASGSRTGSVYLKRITGTGNIQVTLDGTTYSTVDLSDTEWRRIVLSGTVTNPTVGIKLAVSGDAVAMDYGQVEDGLVPTSPILTTTATATRAVDAVSMTGTSFDSWYIPFVELFYAKVSKNNATTNFPTIIGFSGNGSTYFQGNSVRNTNGAVVINSGITYFANDILKVAVTESNLYRAISANGVAPVSSNTQIRRQVRTLLEIGRDGTSNYLNGTIARIIYFPIRATDNVLQELTK